MLCINKRLYRACRACWAGSSGSSCGSRGSCRTGGSCGTRGPGGAGRAGQRTAALAAAGAKRLLSSIDVHTHPLPSLPPDAAICPILCFPPPFLCHGRLLPLCQKLCIALHPADRYPCPWSCHNTFITPKEGSSHAPDPPNRLALQRPGSRLPADWLCERDWFLPPVQYVLSLLRQPIDLCSDRTAGRRLPG